MAKLDATAEFVASQLTHVGTDVARLSHGPRGAERRAELVREIASRLDGARGQEDFNEGLFTRADSLDALFSLVLDVRAAKGWR